MTDQQLNDVWTYEQTEHMTSAAILDSEGFDIGHIKGVGLDQKGSAEKLAWRIIADHNLGLLAAHAPQSDRARLIEKAFELAIANGHSYQYEGWGGRYKTRHIGPDEYRKNLLERAALEIPARSTFAGPQRFTTAGQQPAPDVSALVEALEEISDPIRFMEERLEEGERLNGMAAVQLAGDASYLRGIARAALDAHRRETDHDDQ